MLPPGCPGGRGEQMFIASAWAALPAANLAGKVPPYYYYICPCYIQGQLSQCVLCQAALGDGTEISASAK